MLHRVVYDGAVLPLCNTSQRRDLRLPLRAASTSGAARVLRQGRGDSAGRLQRGEDDRGHTILLVAGPGPADGGGDDERTGSSRSSRQSHSCAPPWTSSSPTTCCCGASPAWGPSCRHQPPPRQQQPPQKHTQRSSAVFPCSRLRRRSLPQHLQARPTTVNDLPLLTTALAQAREGRPENINKAYDPK